MSFYTARVNRVEPENSQLGPNVRFEIVRASAPLTHETHTHELRREGGQMVLRRVRIDCGFAHH